MNTRTKHPRGIALMLVVTAVALASVLGFVMLSSAALQTRAAANQGRLSAADYLAESGLNIAMYYLQYPESAPGYGTNFGGVGYWTGTGGYISIGSGVDGTVDVSVTRDASDIWTYEIVSSARTGTNSQTQLTKQTGARVYVRNEYVVKHAGAFNGNTIVQPYMTFVGDVWASKNFAMRSTSPTPSVSGTIYCKTPTPSGSGYQSITYQACPTIDSPAPSSGTNGLNKYATYTVNDVTYSRQTITDSSLSSGTTLGTSASNPAGIWYRDASSGGDFQIGDNVTINGTLVVDGNVRIRGAGIVINAQTGYPGLIVTGNLQIEQPSKHLTVNGICYVGGQLQTSTTSTPSPALISKLTINGALLTGTTGSTNTMTGYNVTTVVTYNAAKAKAPEMSANYRVAKGVSIVRWGLP